MGPDMGAQERGKPSLEFGVDAYRRPAAPTGLTAAAGDAQVVLDWANNTEPNLAGYNVYRSTTSGGPFNTALNGSLLTVSDYTDNSVANGTTYFYVVTAADSSANESDDSAQVSATPAAGAATSHQAENGAVSTGGVLNENLNAGYTGSGYANTVNAVGAWWEITVNVATAGSYSVDFRFANGGTADRLTDLSINGSVVQSGISFPVTGWTAWSNAIVTHNLSAGSNTLRLTAATADGCANIDKLTITPVGNTAPTISDIADQTISAGGTTGALAFTVGDAETAAGSLTLTGGSSNTTLVPTGNIVFGGSGANRTVTVTPAAGQTGTATITVTVADGSSPALTASDTFVLTVTMDPANTFYDHFSDGNATGWTTDGGSWSVVSGNYRQSDVNVASNRSVRTGTNWANQVVEADVRYTGVSGSDRFFGVVARYVGPGDYYYFILRTNGTVELKKLAGGVTVPLATAVNQTVTLNTWYRLTLEVEGSNLRGYINGALVLSGTDSQHAVGKIGLITFFTTVEFDNVFAGTSPNTAPPGAFSLSTPANAATNVSLTPTLDWGDSSGAASYTLLLDNDSDFSSPLISQGGMTSSQLVVGSALANGTTYYWRVAALNSGGSTNASNNAFSFTTVPATPAPPSALAATALAYNRIDLSWTDNAGNETGFKIERKKGSAGTYAQIGTVGAGVTTYSDSSCGAGTQYYYRVRAYNTAGDSAYSNEANATTSEITSGRQAHWKFDAGSGTSATDETSNNPGTLTNGPTWVAGKIGSAVNFDAVDDVITAGSGASLDNLPAVTITAWIKANSIGEGGNPGRIVHKGTATAATNGWQFVLQGTNSIGFAVDHATSDLNRVSASNAITLGAWRHVAVTWTGSATATNAKLYVDGVEVGSYVTTVNGVGSRTSDAASSVFIGNDNSGARTFDGALDDVRIFNRVITAAELTAIYRAGL